MYLHGAQQSHPHYPRNKSGWKMYASWAHCHIEHTGWPRRRVGAVQEWAAHSFCMSVSFHNSSAEHDCQASLQLQRSIRACHLAITTERWGPGVRIPLAPSALAIPPSSPVSQPAPCSGLKEIIKLYQQIRNSSRLPPTAATPSDFPWDALCIKAALTFFHVFYPKLNVSFLLIERKERKRHEL